MKSLRSLLQRWFFRGSDRRPPLDLFELLNGAWIGQAVYTALSLGLIEALEKGPQSVNELAAAIAIDPQRLGQLLRALASFGVIECDESARYQLTGISRSLLAGEQSWQRQYVLLWGEQLYPAAGQMSAMLRTNQDAFQLAHGAPLYRYYQEEPSADNRFVEFMNAVTEWQLSEIVQKFDFSRFPRMVDVGCGKASLLTALLQACPEATGVLLDQPHMQEPIQQQIQAAGLQDRCRFVGGSFFEKLAVAGDLFLIKHVLHDWPDEEAQRILARISEAMADDSCLVIIEGVLDQRADNQQLLAMRDLEQMVWTGGRLRSRTEFARLLANCGLSIREILPTSISDADLLICSKILGKET